MPQRPQVRRQPQIVAQVVAHDGQPLHDPARRAVLVADHAAGGAQGRAVGRIEFRPLRAQQPMAVPALPPPVGLRGGGEFFHRTLVEVDKQLRPQLRPRLAVGRPRHHHGRLPQFAEEFIEAVLA